MSSMFDMFIKENIMASCEVWFNEYLVEQGSPEDALTDKEREPVSLQIDYILGMVEGILREHTDAEEAYTEILDKMIGMCVVSKMNEARLCKVINDLLEKKDN